MRDDVFDNRCYDDVFRRVFEFEQYRENREHFWIELDYYITRDRFVSRIGESLSINVCSYSGDQIFRDAIDKATISNRPYKVINERIEPQGEWQDIYKVTELYGYAPDVTFTYLTSEIVKIPGVRDWGNYVSKVAANFALSQGFSEISFDDTDGVFEVGDTISFSIDVSRFQDSYQSEVTTITRKAGSLVYCNDVSWTDTYPDSPLYGDTLTTARIVQEHATHVKNVTRRYAESMSHGVQKNIECSVTYHTSYPAIERRFAVVNSQNSETDQINESTVPSTTTWQTWQANGTKIIPFDPEVVGIYTLYKKTVKRCDCDPLDYGTGSVSIESSSGGGSSSGGSSGSGGSGNVVECSELAIENCSYRNGSICTVNGACPYRSPS